MPLAEREAIFSEVHRLKQSNPDLDFAALRRLLSSRFERLPSLETLKRWNANTAAPMTSVNKFEAEPSEEFRFFLGAWLGDGWADQSDGGKRLRLKVRSREFAEEFARSTSVILHKANPYVASQIEEENGTWYQVKVTSLLLYELANRSFGELVRYIEPHPAGFLRGFFTAEGNPSVAVSHDSGHAHLEVTICVSNTDLQYLHYALELVKQLGYHPTKITRGDRPGLERTIGKRTFITTKTEWQFRIARIAEVESFLLVVGFADPLKQEKTWTALNLIRKFGAHSAVVEWTKVYAKVGRKWTKRVPA